MQAPRFLRSAPSLPSALALLACATLLAACGGGGGESPAAAANGSATPGGTTTTTTTSSTFNSGVTDGSCGLGNFQAEVLQRLNAHRAAGANCGSTAYPATTALAWNDKLTQAAAGHSQDMAQRNYFSHDTPEGTTLGQRVDAVAYRWSIAGENIAAGQTTLEKVVADLMASPSHCANIMSAAFKDVGVACMPGTASSKYVSYWTMDFAAP